jgi:hypothetical protein
MIIVRFYTPHNKLIAGRLYPISERKNPLLVHLARSGGNLFQTRLFIN